MGEDPRTGSEEVTATSEPEQVERQIEETREQLGETVEALAQKTDVKAQAKQKLDDTKANVSAKTERLVGKAKEASPETTSEAAAQASQAARENPLPLAALGAFAAGFLTGRITKR